MKLFSKRNKKDEIRRSGGYPNSRFVSSRYSIHSRAREQGNFQFLIQSTRIRLISLVKFLTSTDSFLEKYILVDNQKVKIHYFNQRLLDDFSESELGYKFSNYFDFNPFSFNGEFVVLDEEKEYGEYFYDDYVLFDILETTILFSKEEQRKNVISRISNILLEENSGFIIKENIITRDEGENLKSIAIQLRDKKLSSKINSYYSFARENDWINASKISAEILNIIISDESEDKKITIEKLWNDLSESIILNYSAETKQVKDFKKMIDLAAVVCKEFNNGVFDVRHSEKDRVKVSNEYLYKMICFYNISLIEVILTSLKDKYVEIENWEEIKNKYIETYKINKDTFYYVADPKTEEDVNVDDIPF